MKTPDKTPALKQYFGDTVDISQGLERTVLPALDPQAQKLRMALDRKHAEQIRNGLEVSYPLVGKTVKVAASFRPGDLLLLRSDLGKGDGTPYTVVGTVGPRTSFSEGKVEFVIGGKVGVDTQRRPGVLISDIADPTKTSFSLEAVRDTLAGSWQLPATEATGAVHTSSGKVSPNPRHIWGVLLEADPSSAVANEINYVAGNSLAARAGMPDTWEETGGNPRLLLTKASVDTKNPNAPIPVTLSTIMFSENNQLTQAGGIEWSVVLRKQFMDEAVLDNGVIQPIRADMAGAQEMMVEMALVNMDSRNLGRSLRSLKDQRMSFV